MQYLHHPNASAAPETETETKAIAILGKGDGDNDEAQCLQRKNEEYRAPSRAQSPLETLAVRCVLKETHQLGLPVQAGESTLQMDLHVPPDVVDLLDVVCRLQICPYQYDQRGQV